MCRGVGYVYKLPGYNNLSIVIPAKKINIENSIKQSKVKVQQKIRKTSDYQKRVW